MPDALLATVALDVPAQGRLDHGGQRLAAAVGHGLGLVPDGARFGHPPAFTEWIGRLLMEHLGRELALSATRPYPSDVPKEVTQ